MEEIPVPLILEIWTKMQRPSVVREWDSRYGVWSYGGGRFWRVRAILNRCFGGTAFMVRYKKDPGF